MNEPHHELQLTDPKIALRDTETIPQISLRGALTGTLTTNGQEEAMTGYVWAPSGTWGIRFVCRANAALIIKNVITGVMLICCLVFFSCRDNKKNEESNKFALQKDFEYVHLIPDSLRTSAQNELYELLLKTIVMHLKVENNNLVLDLSEKEFLNLKIPKPYYDLLQHDIKEVNRHVDNFKIREMDNILLESYKDLYKRFHKNDSLSLD